MPGLANLTKEQLHELARGLRESYSLALALVDADDQDPAGAPERLDEARRIRGELSLVEGERRRRIGLSWAG